MPSVTFNIILAFTFSFLGTLVFRSHLISTLLCLEGILSLFIITTITSLNSHTIIIYPIPIVIFVFAACEAAIGLARLAKVSNSYGTDYVQKSKLTTMLKIIFPPSYYYHSPDYQIIKTYGSTLPPTAF
uniref:NADH-ubiquinone oxidoreductase chain 4L n=1 Tax=Peromyscus maniculatus bairdii TaxID=230844 RepID=A0A8C8UMM4_PERMB